MKTVAIVQARLGSTRLPGKILMDLEGEPVLVHVMNRLGQASALDELVLAIPDQKKDDPLAAFCAERSWPCFRGSENDVLDRYYGAAREAQADAVVRITSDCPLIEPSIVDQVVREFLECQPGADYVSNTLLPRTFPRGLDTEVMTFAALEKAWREDQDPVTREHVTPYIYRTPGAFVLRSVKYREDLSAMRWTLDTPEDLEFIRKIYTHFGHDRFPWNEVLELLRAHPDWMEINRNVQQKPF